MRQAVFAAQRSQPRTKDRNHKDDRPARSRNTKRNQTKRYETEQNETARDSIVSRKAQAQTDVRVEEENGGGGGGAHRRTRSRILTPLAAGTTSVVRLRT